MSKNLDRLCRTLNYEFSQLSRLKQALTHCSAGSDNNERFEFLGDSILSFVIANALFEKFPDQSEGQLSRARAHLVKGEMLAEIASEIGLGDYLYLGQGELKSGGFRRASILADALEAIFAAVYLDGGLSACEQVILALYHARLQHECLTESLKDAKTQLQEHLQAQKLPLPNYILAQIEGEEHKQIFTVTCEIPKLKQSAKAQGTSRRKAEQKAARALLQQLKQT